MSELNKSPYCVTLAEGEWVVTENIDGKTIVIDTLKEIVDSFKRTEHTEQWIPVETPPEEDKAAWYQTANKSDLSVVPRYWDGEVWWIFSNHHDNRTLVPNNSLAYYKALSAPPKGSD